MSSGDEFDILPRSKKRRTPRACDFCRRRKIRCNSAQMPNNNCSNCIEFGVDCTHNEAAKRRAPAKSYVESLEQRLEKLEKLLHELSPDNDFTQELGDVFPSSAGGEPSSLAFTSPSQVAPIITMLECGGPVNEAEDPEINALTAKMQQLPFMNIKNRFFGEGSSFMFVQTALDHKKEFTGIPNSQVFPFNKKRPDFWTVGAWELKAIEENPPKYDFPESDLIHSLCDLYFKKENIFMPLLHRPTFERSIKDGLHLQNHMFGATVLLVCAIGARHSDDQRVLVKDANSRHSAGWKWYHQVQLLRNKSFLFAPSLYELQAYCLMLSWLLCSSTPQVQWPMLGLGIRLAQDIGAHRRKPHHLKSTAQDELTKRAFWILVCHDRNLSTFTGRPRALQDDDFDQDFPIECDDEYWENEDPHMAFKQPPDKPSTIAYFNSFLKLGDVLGHVLRTIYSISKSKTLSGIVRPEWEQQTVAELDSTLNKWIDSVPDHLRWDPHREHDLFFTQSAALFTHYYHLQILIHRPFISAPSKPSRLTFPSLAICTNAARSCCHVADVTNRRGEVTAGHMQMAVFVSSIVLLLNIWGGKKAGILTDPNREMGDVHKCMRILKAVEDRSYPAGRFWDIICELASVGDLPLPRTNPEKRNKRGREADEPESRSASTDGHSVRDERQSSEDIPSPQSTSISSEQSLDQNPAQEFTLPMYTDELGRLPLHGQFDFFSHINPSSASRPDYPIESTSISDNSQIVASPTFEMSDLSLFNASIPATFDPSTGTDPFSFLQTHSSLPGSGDHLWNPTPPSDPTPMPNDAYSMWSNAPTTFGLIDWGMYVSNVSVDPTNLYGRSEDN